MCGVAPGSNGSKEMHYVLRVLSPAACRNPDVLTRIGQNLLRIIVVPPKRGTNCVAVLVKF